NQAINTPEHNGAVVFKEELEKATNGRVKVEIYPAQQLGSVREQVEGTQIGSIQMTMQPTGVVAPFISDIEVVDMPYLWPADLNVVHDILDGELGTELLGKLEKGQFKGLGYWSGGFKLFTTSK